MSTAPSLPPPLRSGERLTREEFLRRWEAEPALKKAELIEGIVYVPSPVSHAHSLVDVWASGWLMVYSSVTPGTEPGSNATWLMLQSAPQPDAHLRIMPQHGGHSRIENGYCAGVPELAIEMTRSTSVQDLGAKLRLYQRAGVQEYLIVLLPEARVLWHTLVNGVYQQLAPDSDGVVRSRTFPGLWLDPAALLAGDTRRVLEVLQQGIASPEHQAFVERLRTAAGLP